MCADPGSRQLMIARVLGSPGGKPRLGPPCGAPWLRGPGQSDLSVCEWTSDYSLVVRVWDCSVPPSVTSILRQIVLRPGVPSSDR